MLEFCTEKQAGCEDGQYQSTQGSEDPSQANR